MSLLDFISCASTSSCDMGGPPSPAPPPGASPSAGETFDLGRWVVSPVGGHVVVGKLVTSWWPSMCLFCHLLYVFRTEKARFYTLNGNKYWTNAVFERKKTTQTMLYGSSDSAAPETFRTVIIIIIIIIYLLLVCYINVIILIIVENAQVIALMFPRKIRV